MYKLTIILDRLIHIYVSLTCAYRQIFRQEKQSKLTFTNAICSGMMQNGLLIVQMYPYSIHRYNNEKRFL
jgi:hypothetical protein